MYGQRLQFPINKAAFYPEAMGEILYKGRV